jgi:hypothetical protein
MPDDGKFSSSLHTLPLFSSIRFPGAKLALLTRAMVFHGADSDPPELRSFPNSLST